MQNIDAVALHRRLEELSANLQQVAAQLASYRNANPPCNRLRLSEDLALFAQNARPESEQPNLLLQFLTLLLGSLQRQDLLNHKDIKNLRLVNVETKAFMDKAAPLTNIKPYDQSASCIWLCTHGPPVWPSLTSLELHEDYQPVKTFGALARAPFPALKKLTYSNCGNTMHATPTPVEPEILAAVFSNLKGLTDLNLTIKGISNRWFIFREDDFPELEVARLYIRTVANSANPHAATTCFPAWPKLRELHLKHPENYAFSRLEGYSSTLQTLTSLSFHFRRFPPNFFYVFSFLNVCHIQELVLLHWTPLVCSFQGVCLPSLKNLEVHCRNHSSTACYMNLANTTFPSLEILKIPEKIYHEQYLPAAFIPSLFAVIPANDNPFPVLHTFHLVRSMSHFSAGAIENLTEPARKFIKRIIPTLRELELWGVDDESLNTFFDPLLDYAREDSPWPHLRKLTINGSELTLKKMSLFVSVAARCPSLQQLQIHDGFSGYMEGKLNK